jgi:ABC-2 type transport system ATP-binding protein
MTDVVIAASGLTKVYPSQRAGSAALSDVSFEVRANEILAVVGPNAAGKTTLLDLLATTVVPTAGSLTIGGVDAIANPPSVRSWLGYHPSGGRAVYPRLTAIQNLCFFASLYGFCRDEARRRADAALRICGADQVRADRIDRLSDGMVARVTLARALLHDPRVLLLDEPTRSIDPVQRPALHRAIRRFVNQPGKSSVLVTHDLSEVFEIADRVAVMKDGRVTHLAKVAATSREQMIQADVSGGDVA